MSLDVVCGPMKSSKSSTLLQKLNTFSDINTDKSLVINHALDTRNVKKGISSHSSLYDGIGNLDFISCHLLANVNVTKHTNIGIDEVQFFEKDDLINTVKYWLSIGKHLVCSGLDGDATMQPFGHIASLLHMSNTFVKLNAICDVCRMELIEQGIQITPLNQTPAPFTKKIIPNDVLVDVGGSDIYLSVCRKHHS